MVVFDDFKQEVFDAMSSKPKEWRDGQFVFNYIDEKYGVARYVQFVDKTDCFHNDENIDVFILRCVERLNALQ